MNNNPQNPAKSKNRPIGKDFKPQRPTQQNKSIGKNFKPQKKI